MRINDIKVWSLHGVRNVMALWLSGLHRETPRLAKAIGLFVVVYVASPFDLTPVLAPMPSYLDDLVLLAGLSWLGPRMLPSSVWQECCARSDHWLRIAADGLRRVWMEVLFFGMLTALAAWLWLWFGLARA